MWTVYDKRGTRYTYGSDDTGRLWIAWWNSYTLFVLLCGDN